MNGRYILTPDHRVVPEPDLLTWAHWLENTDRGVGQDMIGPYWVSTVFLGLDHDFMWRGTYGHEIDNPNPLIFETMVFDNSREETSPYFSRSFHPTFNFQRRYRSWDEAVAGHAYAVKIVTRMLRWMDFRSLRTGSEVDELRRLHDLQEK